MSSITYKDSGVDIDAGAQLVNNIAPMVSATKRAGVLSKLGGFGGLFDLKAEGYNDPVLVSGTDGVGTKLKIAIESGCHNTVGIDLVAMCANDILVQGAQPLFFMDYFATGKLDIQVAQEVIEGIVEGCHQAGAALLGGETAEMPDFYPDAHYDLAGFCVGAVERAQILPKSNQMQEGDILIGLPSTGFHANGFSLVRKLLAHHKINFNDPCPWDKDKKISEALLVPTKIYVHALMDLINRDHITAMAHITGGGLSENIPRMLPENLGCQINLNAWALPSAMGWMQQAGNLENSELLTTFNCGIAMVLSIKPDQYDAVIDVLNQKGEAYMRIGNLTSMDTQNERIIYEGSFINEA